MPNIQHSALTYSENHVAHAYQYSTEVQREAAAGFVAADIGKLALQMDDLSLWMLSDNSPITWVRVIQTANILADTISESTSAAGVTIDGVLIKDNAVTATGGVTANLTGNVTGNVTGNLTGNVTGTVSGNAGTVTNGVYTTGNQTIGGTKTFSSTIIGNLQGNVTGNVTGNVSGSSGSCTGNAATATTATTATTVAATGVTQSALKSTTGAVSSSTTTTLTLPGGEYGFVPQVKFIQGTASVGVLNCSTGRNGFTSSYATTIYLELVGLDGTATGYAQQRYIQASPPYKIGDTSWGHFLYLLRNTSTGEVISSYEAQDPPWAYNGSNWLHKNDPELLALVPHPFTDYWDKEPSVDGLEIVLVDLRDIDLNVWLYDNMGRGKNIIENFKEFAPLGKKKTHKKVGLPDIPGFSNKVSIVARS